MGGLGLCQRGPMQDSTNLVERELRSIGRNVGGSHSSTSAAPRWVRQPG